jgi:hypothetical protein
VARFSAETATTATTTITTTTTTATLCLFFRTLGGPLLGLCVELPLGGPHGLQVACLRCNIGLNIIRIIIKITANNNNNN